ncbi:MAG: MmcQ/YjbR family DNA-binding protein [Bacteroidia bacterium]
MNIEEIRKYCLELPHVTEDVKWENDLCFLLAEKMFVVTCLVLPFRVSFAVKPDEFDELIETDGIIPAPYMARNKWIQVQDENRFTKKEWEYFLMQAYEIKKNKLPKNIINKLKLN